MGLRNGTIMRLDWQRAGLAIGEARAACGTRGLNKTMGLGVSPEEQNLLFQAGGVEGEIREGGRRAARTSRSGRRASPWPGGSASNAWKGLERSKEVQDVQVRRTTISSWSFCGASCQRSETLALRHTSSD